MTFKQCKCKCDQICREQQADYTRQRVIDAAIAGMVVGALIASLFI